MNPVVFVVVFVSVITLYLKHHAHLYAHFLYLFTASEDCAHFLNK